MISIKKKIFFIVKSTFTIIILLVLALFFYTAFFYEPTPTEKSVVEKKITKNEEVAALEKELKEEEETGSKEPQVQEKIVEPEVAETSEVLQGKTEIKDALFATVGNRAITFSDILYEMKIILVLNGQSFSEEMRDKLRAASIKSIVKRTIKQIEIDKYDGLKFNKTDLDKEINRLASNINVDIKTLKSICENNDINFEIITHQIKTDLLWNSLIFDLYKNRISINQNEIEEQLAMIQKQENENTEEYLISEIVIKPIDKDKLGSKINELKKRIKTEGFNKVAMDISISKTATNGGNLGWISINTIAKDFKTIIANTAVGNISEPILLPQGVLIFMVKDKRKTKNIINLEEAKDQLVNSEKMKILDMYSLSHFDSIRRSVSINYF